MHGETFQFIDVIVNFLNVTLPANYTNESSALSSITQIRIVSHLHKYTIIYDTSS